MDLRDIEIYLLGLKSLHRQRCSYPYPRDNYTRALSRVRPSEEASVLNSLRCCDGCVESMATVWAMWKQRSRDYRRHQWLRMDTLRRATGMQSFAYISIA